MIGDPEKKLYLKYGVESLVMSVLNPKAMKALFKGLLIRNKPKISIAPTGGLFGKPADFLIAPNGTIQALHYGKHADDQWSVDEMLGLSRKPLLSEPSRDFNIP